MNIEEFFKLSCCRINYISERLKKYNIYYEDNTFKFNLKKIDPTSLAAKENITGIEFIFKNEIDFEMLLCINYEIIYTEKFGFPKKIDIVFPVKDLLINIFDIIGIKLYNKYNISKENIKNIEEIKKQFKRIEPDNYFVEFSHLQKILNFMDNKKKNILELRKEHISIDTLYHTMKDKIHTKISKLEKMLKEEQTTKHDRLENSIKEKNLTNDPVLKEEQTYKCFIYTTCLESNEEHAINEINKQKEILEKIKNKLKQFSYNTIKTLNFLNLEILNFFNDFVNETSGNEIVIFSEIFNFKTEQEVNEINIIRQNYIYYAKLIENKFKNINDLKLLINEINYFIRQL